MPWIFIPDKFSDQTLDSHPAETFLHALRHERARKGGGITHHEAAMRLGFHLPALRHSVNAQGLREVVIGGDKYIETVSVAEYAAKHGIPFENHREQAVNGEHETPESVTKA